MMNQVGHNLLKTQGSREHNFKKLNKTFILQNTSVTMMY